MINEYGVVGGVRTGSGNQVFGDNVPVPLSPPSIPQDLI
jgi:hypothetical protein